MSGLAKTLFGQVTVSFPSFVVALGAAVLALVWLEVSWVVSATIFAVLLFGGAMSYLIGDAYLNQDRPKAVAAERWLRWTIAAPIAFAVFAGAAILVLGIETAPKESWSEQQKQLTAAFAAALTTYVTTVFIKGADEADEGWVGKLVKDRFETRLKDRFPTSQTTVRDAAFQPDAGLGRRRAQGPRAGDRRLRSGGRTGAAERVTTGDGGCSSATPSCASAVAGDAGITC